MRFSTHAVLFILIANALIGAAAAAGMWDAWGFEPTPHTSQELKETKDEWEKLTAGGSAAETLIGLFIFAGQTASAGFAIVTSLPEFLENVGVPGFIAQIPSFALIVLVGRDVLSIMTGRKI